MRPDLPEFYSSVCACPNSARECPGVVNAPRDGCPPRGFFSAASPGSVSILVVGKNPGHLLETERSLYLGKSPPEIAAAHLAFAGRGLTGGLDSHPGASRNLRFHRNVVRYLTVLLAAPPAAVLRQVAFTNLVKCSTLGEQDRLAGRTMRECYQRHLRREIEFFGPRMLLALGREVERFLRAAQAMERAPVPVLYIKHPSYNYSRATEAGILEALREATKRILGIAQQRAAPDGPR
jgi:hypothetical protein